MRPLPTWVPRISRPFDPDRAAVFDVMTDDEKRWSFLVDVAIVAGVLYLAWYFS
jgi:hypothetical protein